jgi:asparagine synthase (glutamine-hydrolysing)
MCGIGVSLDTRGLGRSRPWATPLMRHRGPDAQQTLDDRDAQLVLEHCRLAIIDPANPEAVQPFTDPTGRWTIVYNGEVFNFRELRRDLERRGHSFRTESDTEVVLQSYIADREEAFPRFRGMFAIVIWDREGGELVAARDQIGVKPLYYADLDGLFVAASELRTIAGHPEVRRSLDPEAVVEYLAFGITASDRTLVERVRKLPPGHFLRLRGSVLELHEYWDVLPPPAPPRPEDEEDELLRHLEESVAAALVSDVPVSLMLSGGLDSSAVAALASRHVDPAELTAYSVSFGLPSDESSAAARLASDLGIRHRELLLTEDALKAAFNAWLDDMDVPTANPTWIAVSHIARAVRADGTKVLLSGDGADELFGGYNRWMTYLRFHERLWRHVPTGLRRAGGAGVKPFTRGLARDIARRASEGGELFVGSRPFHDDLLARSLGPVGREVAEASPPETQIERLRRRFDERMPGGDYLNWMSYAALKTDLVEDYLARLDKMGMGESVEGRVPLLDPALATFAFSLPRERKVKDFEQKALFRRTVSRLLPDYITSRPKQGFCPPVADWAASLMPARLNGDSPLYGDGLVAPDAVRRLMRRPSSNGSFALWTLGTLMIWAERHM